MGSPRTDNQANRVLSLNRVLESPNSHDLWAVETARWILDDICSPVPELGRPGALCPYVPAAIRKETMTLTGCDLPEPGRTELVDQLIAEAEWLAGKLSHARASERTWIAHIVVFTRLTANHDVLTGIREELRRPLLRTGITIGEFYPTCTTGSVRKQSRRISRSPWPCFALRAFASHDELYVRMRPDVGVDHLTEIHEHLAEVRRTFT